jgi:hypothetical protein
VITGKLVHVTLDLFVADEHGSLDSGGAERRAGRTPHEPHPPARDTPLGRRVDDTTAPWETGPEHAVQSDLTAKSAGIWAAPSRKTSR